MLKRITLLFCFLSFTISISPAIADAASDYFNKIKQEAEQGNAEAQDKLGSMYQNREGVERVTLSDGTIDYGKDAEHGYQQALYWYKKAAEQDYAKAQMNLGQMYENGWGVKKDISTAKKYYGLACSNDLSKGCDDYIRLSQ